MNMKSKLFLATMLFATQFYGFNTSAEEQATVAEAKKAFLEIHDLRQKCEGADVRILTGLVALNTGILSGGAIAVGNAPNLKDVLGKIIDQSHINDLKRGAVPLPDTNGKVVRLTVTEVKPLKAATKLLTKAGYAGAAIAAVLGVAALAADNDTAISTKDKIGNLITDLVHGSAGISSVGDRTVSGFYVSNAKAFVDQFLNLPPDKAEHYLLNSPQLRNLTVGYSKYIEYVKNQQEIKTCTASRFDTGVAGASAIISQQGPQAQR